MVRIYCFFAWFTLTQESWFWTERKILFMACFDCKSSLFFCILGTNFSHKIFPACQLIISGAQQKKTNVLEKYPPSCPDDPAPGLAHPLCWLPSSKMSESWRSDMSPLHEQPNDQLFVLKPVYQTIYNAISLLSTTEAQKSSLWA